MIRLLFNGTVGLLLALMLLDKGYEPPTFIIDAVRMIPSVSQAPTPKLDPTMQASLFNDQVSTWSRDLMDAQGCNGGGNCVPVALELQKRIRDAGYIAFVIAVDPDPNDGIMHAVVLYDSDDPDFVLDSVIDNGYSTDNYPRKAKMLYSGVFGEYKGKVEKCVDCNNCVIGDTI